MEATKGQRLHIGIFGNTNSGKSTLMNMLVGQDYSIVSEVSGTTTDSVQKSMELPDIGPAVFIDTAGFNDKTELGKKRLAKTYDALAKCDVLIAVISSEELKEADNAGAPEKILQTEGFQKLIQNGKPVIWVITKAKADEKPALQKAELFKNNQPVFVDSASGKNSGAKKAIFSAIKNRIPDDFYSTSLTEKYCKPGDNVLLVMPQDSQAPKGRLILPQVQTIRDLLDRKVCIHCCTQNTFLQTIDSLKNPPDLIITDSQIFPFVNDNKPASSKLTSFSILMAAYKGDIELFVQGAKALKMLSDNSRVLIAEACTHAPASEDIGTVKIPAMLKKIAPKIQIDFVRGTDFPETPAGLQKYDLIIHCGACMFNKPYVLQRQQNAKAAAVPMTNYGVAIAELNGILDCLYR
ncbi:MAG: [FeFe] hydrogenase H-cluster maturation GTPase HydF [Spirochaetaceae bacterium]|nr:[FeFe] hydrogenase H-cluster maturation GTPase HydF [Spirochaetaceae bacterium]